MSKKNTIIVAIVFLNLLFCAYALDKEDDEFYRAVETYSKGLYKDSIEMFNSFVKTYPDSLKLDMAQLYIAKSLYFKGDYFKAIAIINKIIADRNARNIYDEAYYWLAKIYYILRDYNNSFKYASIVVKQYPESYFIWNTQYIISQIYLRRNNTALAEETLKKIIDNSLDSNTVDNAYLEIMELYYNEGDYDNLGVIASKYLKDNPNGMFKDRAYFYKAENYYHNNSYDEAIKWYSDALAISVSSKLKDSIYQNRGMSFLAKDELARAKLDFSKIQSKERRLFSESMYYLHKGDYVLSLDKLNNFLIIFPKSRFHSLASLHKAELLYRMGRLKDAIYLYKNIIDNAKIPSNKNIIDDAYYGLGWCYIKSGDFKKAIKAFKNTIKSTDDLAVKISSQMQIADSYKERGDSEEALSEYKNILGKYPDNMYADYIYLQIGKIMLDKKEPEKARMNFIAIRNKFPSSQLLPEAIYYTGISYMSENNTDKAKIEFYSFIRKYPYHTLAQKARYLYTKCLIASKDYKDALNYLDEVVNNAPDKELKEVACIDRIKLYYRLYYFNKARDEARRFFKLFPASKMTAFVYLYMGRIYQAQHDYPKAEHFYQVVIDNYNNTPQARQARFFLGVLYFNNNDLDRARHYFNDLANSNNYFSKESRIYLAEILVNEGKKKEALAIYNEIAKGKGETANRALLEYALLLKDMNKYKEAESAFKKLIKRKIDSSRIRFMLGFCLEKLGKPKEAIEEYYKVVYNSNVTDDKVKAYFRMARIYEREDNIIKAKDMYKKIIATGRQEAKVAARRLKELQAR